MKEFYIFDEHLPRKIPQFNPNIDYERTKSRTIFCKLKNWCFLRKNKAWSHGVRRQRWLESTVARSLHFWSQIVISVAKKTMKTKGKYKEKQRALLKVWLQKCSNLATVLERCDGNRTLKLNGRWSCNGNSRRNLQKACN